MAEKDAASADKPRKGRGRRIVCLETGEVYPSVSAAAKAMGVTYGSGNLSQAAIHGGLFKGYHWYYEDQPKPQAGDLKGNKAVTCLETGQSFESAEAAAEWAGTTVKAVYASIRLHSTAGGYQFRIKGSEDKGQANSAIKPHRAVVCWETGEVFESAAVAAAAVGLKTGAAISSAIRRGSLSGGFHWFWQGDPKPDESQLKWLAKKADRSVVCWETGEVFPSSKDAAAAVRLKNASNINAAIREGRTAGGYHWFWEGQPKPAMEELKGFKEDKQAPARTVVCWETGEVFPSAEAAADAMGLKGKASLCSAIKKGSVSGGYHWYWEGDPKPDASELKMPKQLPTRAVVCWETGQVFPSLAAAAEAVGIKSRTNLCFAIKTQGIAGGFHWYYEGDPKPAAEQLGQGRKRPVICWETGEEYESSTAAAKAVGVPSLSAALRSGSMAGGYHWYYKGDPKPDASSFKGNKPVICWETSEVFDSAEKAAEWAGTTVSGIYTALRAKGTSGGYHWYLEGKPRPTEFPPPAGGRKPRPVAPTETDQVPDSAKETNSGTTRGRKPKPVVCAETGEVYASVKEAAAVVGIKEPKNVLNAVRSGGTSGGYHWFYQGEDGPREKKRKQRAVVCWETGEVFPSEEAAAAWAGTSVETIDTVMRTRRTAGGYHWYLEGRPKPDASELVERRGVVCWETGEVYESAEAAAEAAGVSPSTIFAVLNGKDYSAGGFHWYREGEPKPDASQFKPKRNHAIRCIETGEEYESLTAAAKAVGLKAGNPIGRAARTGGTAGGYHWRYQDQAEES